MSSYDFKSLSPDDFEILVRDLLQKELDATLESFKTGRDKGIDFRYSREQGDAFIVQCKHYVKSGYNNLFSHLKTEESTKVGKLKPSRYLLATSVGLTPGNKENIRGLFEPYCISDADIYGSSDLNNLIGKFPEIETRHFKLWLTSVPVMQKVLSSAIFNQSDIEKERVEKKLKYYVQGEGFLKAKKILDDSHCCIISGIPGIGKTTLAQILLFYYYDRHDYEIIKVSGDIEEAFTLFSKDRKQIFYYDDFLGQTRLETGLIKKNEEQRILDFIEMVQGVQNTRFILTTREYILNQARILYEKFDHFDFDINKYILDLAEYTTYDRAKILFNHIYFSSIPEEYKAEMLTSRNYMKIIEHPNYNPRIIESMVDHAVKAGPDNGSFVNTFIESLNNPARIWDHAFRYQLSPEARDILIVLVSLPSRVSIEVLEDAVISFCEYRSPKHYIAQEFRRALNELESNFIHIEKVGFNTVISFHNPSIRDFLENYLTANPTEVRALCASAAYFAQCERLWRIGSNKQMEEAMRVMIVQYQDDFIESIAETIYSKDCGLSITHLSSVGNPTVFSWPKVSLEARLAFLLDILNTTENEKHRETFGNLIEDFLSNFIRGTKDKDVLIAILKQLRTMDTVDYGFSREDFIAAVKELITESPQDMNDFWHCIEFKDALDDNAINEDEWQQVIDQFNEVCQSEVDWYLREGDASMISDFASTLENVANELSIDVHYELNNLNLRVYELEQRSWEDSESDEYEFEPVRDSKATPEEEIHSLFSSLLD